MNNGLLDVYITVFDPRRDKRRCFIPFLVYALVYPSIASNLVALAALSPWPDYYTIKYNVLFLPLNIDK